MRRVRFAIEVALVGVLLWALGLATFRAGSVPPSRGEEELAQVVRVLRGLEQDIERGDALQRMQRMFPEGACFTLTMYGVSWANVAEHPAGDDALKKDAIARLSYAVEQVTKGYAFDPFRDTQVRLGVFWLGQRNLLLARLLRAMPEQERPEHLVTEFHENSQQLADAFLASPHRHLDSYDGMVWPADNVTALLSIVLHDRLYGTDYGRAYQEWKRWTLDHLDPATGLMGGRLDSDTGALLEPARGSGNSWITALLADIDPEFARDLYSRYRKHFAIKRFDFLMFREWQEGVARGEDVDSGPIIWGAGMTATGVGLAAARANGDVEMASDIHALSELVGWPITRGDQTRYVFGRLPVGDAFLAFGKSTRTSIAPKESFRIRPKSHAMLAVPILVLLVVGFFRSNRLSPKSHLRTKLPR
jgi:hypothetical protein